MEIVALILAVLSLVACAALAARVLMLEAKLSTRAAPVLRAATGPAFPDLTPSPLVGRRIALAITQDHPQPIFASLVKELLLREDVAEVVESGDADIYITGRVTCNEYAEVYYEAALECRSGGESIITLLEKPPHGDRQSNLALELVTRLKSELGKRASRTERRSALQELQG